MMMEQRAHRNADPWRCAERRAEKRQDVKEIIDVRDDDKRHTALPADCLMDMPEILEEAQIAERAATGANHLRGRIDKRYLQARQVGRVNASRQRMRRILRRGDKQTGVSRFDARVRGPFGVAPPMSGEVGFDDQESVLCHGPKVAKKIFAVPCWADIGYVMAVLA
ncbi:hypothetical protein [Paraburkholderia sp. BL10I2N1]|uniref:hypothetical protein n=1 Tax=Paraburkholderia sp. BL10I2N1 TaxID=1938796 RepID=UPI003260F71A